MSEQEQTPEKKYPRLYDNCNDCEQDYDLTPENTSLHLHEVNDDCDYARMTCDHCQRPWIMFGLSEDFVLNAVRHGIDPEFRKFPDNKVLTARLGQLGITLAQQHELTPRHELLISVFEETLQNCPDDMLFDLITDENIQPYPPRWI